MSKSIAKWHNDAEIREMARSGTWVKVRRPYCIPYVIPVTEWNALPTAEEGRKLSSEYRQALKGGE